MITEASIKQAKAEYFATMTNDNQEVRDGTNRDILKTGD
jgi:hypothetical protein